ncbi:MAG: preprotein translocase subunit SecG [Acidimicrobiia bacterium]|nr:preprotein translocase subunit SecG [Acidimicrobiia bacterium]MDH3398780.1 preprotein translocase subunit SecG [Acidimicrobiia bacterium]
MDILTTIIVVVHVAVSLALVVLILLHAGRGGGMSDLFGGGMGPAAMSGSTIVERNLDRLTVVTAVTFAVTTMLLSWLLGS